ncbi:zinc-finger-containing protein [Bengtsoniella intestinalis]|uniref:zinc-finger-containing protein n=1 Tax=Bengtsoniella intestinalis TaxID=3073143 RepID=UPI00391F6A2B
MKIPTICRYCGGTITLANPREVFGDGVTHLGLEGEYIYLCRTCNARVGCHRGSTRPLGKVANEVLRLKRRETHQIFDAFWQSHCMSRTEAYHWLGQQMGLSDKKAHIGSFEMDQCQQVIDLCRQNHRKAA